MHIPCYFRPHSSSTLTLGGLGTKDPRCRCHPKGTDRELGGSWELGGCASLFLIPGGLVFDVEASPSHHGKGAARGTGGRRPDCRLGSAGPRNGGRRILGSIGRGRFVSLRGVPKAPGHRPPRADRRRRYLHRRLGAPPRARPGPRRGPPRRTPGGGEVEIQQPDGRRRPVPVPASAARVRSLLPAAPPRGRRGPAPAPASHLRPR